MRLSRFNFTAFVLPVVVVPHKHLHPFGYHRRVLFQLLKDAFGQGSGKMGQEAGAKLVVNPGLQLFSIVALLGLAQVPSAAAGDRPLDYGVGLLLIISLEEPGGGVVVDLTASMAVSAAISAENHAAGTPSHRPVLSSPAASPTSIMPSV